MGIGDTASDRAVSSIFTAIPNCRLVIRRNQENPITVPISPAGTYKYTIGGSPTCTVLLVRMAGIAISAICGLAHRIAGTPFLDRLLQPFDTEHCRCGNPHPEDRGDSDSYS